MTQITGDLSFNMSTNVFSAFVQDDWQIAPTRQGALRRALRPLQVSERASPTRRSRRRTTFNIDKNNFGPRVGVAWSIDPTDRAARQHRPDVRPADSRRLRAGAAAVAARRARRSTPSAGTSAGAPAFPARRADRHARAAVAVGGRSGLPGRAHLADQRRRSSASFGQRLHGVDRLHVCEGRPAAGRHRRQPDQPDRHARRRPADLQHAPSTRRRASDPRFNHINEVQSIGDSTFKSMTHADDQALRARG